MSRAVELPVRRFRVATLASRVVGGARLLDAQVSSDLATLWFGAGAPPDLCDADGNTIPCEIVPGGSRVTVRQSECATITVGDTPFDVTLGPIDAGFLAGKRVMLGVRHSETAAVTATWLDHHAKHHGADAALILDLGRFSDADLDDLRQRTSRMEPAPKVVVVRSPIALGDPTLPPAHHPFNAPAAPGRARMQRPPPDPEAAPLSESLVFEVLRRRFLMGARSVLNLDVSDLLLPDHSERSIFQRAEAADGYLSFLGTEAYPWRISKSSATIHADHIYTQFDRTARRRRWATRPGREGETTWRFIRIAGDAAVADNARFVRCMALRHPGHPVSKLVPKSALVEDDGLVDLAIKTFGHRPVRAPRVEPVKAEAGPGHVTVVTCMKNEGPFILEWLAHHRSIGVDRFLVYSNDCDDGTDRMLDILAERGLVAHRENPFRGTGQKPQHAAFQAAEAEEIVSSADWLLTLDVDEFINVHVGSGHISDLFKAVPDANMISMTWRLFGNADIDTYADQPVTEQFMRCAPKLARKPHQAWGFKTLYRRAGLFRKIGVHRPKGLIPQLKKHINWVNGSGRPMPEGAYRNAWRSTASTYGYDLVTLNHYAVRSAESFLVKRDRGRVNHVDRDQGLIYWFRMNNNSETDRSISDKGAGMRVELERLLADSEIRAAHEFCVSRHKEKIAALKSRPDYAAFFEDLSGERMKKLSRLHDHFGSGVFWSGPQVVPDEVVARNPDDRFFFTVDPVGKGH